MKNKLLWLLTLNAGLFASVPNPANVIVGDYFYGLQVVSYG